MVRVLATVDEAFDELLAFDESWRSTSSSIVPPS